MGWTPHASHWTPACTHVFVGSSLASSRASASSVDIAAESPSPDGASTAVTPESTAVARSLSISAASRRMDSTCAVMTSTGLTYAARVPGRSPDAPARAARAAAAGSPADTAVPGGAGPAGVPAPGAPSTRLIVGAPPLGPIVSSNVTLPPSPRDEKSFAVVVAPWPFLLSTALTTCEICAAPVEPWGMRTWPMCTRLGGIPFAFPFAFPVPTPTPWAAPSVAAGESGGRCTSKIVSPSVRRALETR
mmetsp:Transcript_10976/g.42751  ORF Transcript_10976/g.42751 Transcript_10976/m.42751 type:complete len:247 (+) Transcript_10976:1741-2481(+)